HTHFLAGRADRPVFGNLLHQSDLAGAQGAMFSEVHADGQVGRRSAPLAVQASASLWWPCPRISACPLSGPLWTVAPSGLQIMPQTGSSQEGSSSRGLLLIDLG